jgi:hypothetical protein
MSVYIIEMLCVSVVSVFENAEEILFTKKQKYFAHARIQALENRRIWLQCAGGELCGVKWRSACTVRPLQKTPSCDDRTK